MGNDVCTGIEANIYEKIDFLYIHPEVKHNMELQQKIISPRRTRVFLQIEVLGYDFPSNVSVSRKKYNSPCEKENKSAKDCKSAFKRSTVAVSSQESVHIYIYIYIWSVAGAIHSMKLTRHFSRKCSKV